MSTLWQSDLHSQCGTSPKQEASAPMHPWVAVLTTRDVRSRWALATSRTKKDLRLGGRGGTGSHELEGACTPEKHLLVMLTYPGCG